MADSTSAPTATDGTTAAPKVDIPSTTRAGCVVNPGPDFSVTLKDDIKTPSPGPSEVLIKLTHTGICYSDLHYMLEDLPSLHMKTQYGIDSPGHEGIGHVVALGSNVAKESVPEIKLGDRVGLKPVWSSCGMCELCCDEREMYCVKSVQTGLHVAGTYQQYVLGRMEHVVRIPDGVDGSVAAPVMCAGATIYRGITEAGLKPGQWVIFSGAGGGVGHMGVLYAKAMGMRVIAIDGGADKGKMCLSIGADHFIDFLETPDLVSEVQKLTDGLGAHGLIVTASSSKAYVGGLALLRTSGVMMCIGIVPVTDIPSVADPLSLLGGNKKVMGTIVGTRSDARKALDYCARGLVKPHVTEYSWSQLPEAVDKLRKGQVAGRCVVKFDD
ncbi:Alcohol dehydrogenase 1 [Cyphellophora attinorum]|uniref:Alcohol dehydrogenase 1 n=1 Tax=Cyphellophora attinorum TaxID=1664694 RepID=A0A0N0NLK4_9EURO|nr:Alcohol dehydrogenase 1 [Phialophora attinorum]KPI39411.1 Alcohol dehydrogenase 1 [Phialophora attinorum]